MADVSSSLKNWSTTASSNSPAGSTSIGGGLDDNLREIQAVVRQLASSDTIASATTTDIGSKDSAFLTISGTTTITGLGTVAAGIWKFVTFSGALTLTHNGTSLILPGSANISTAAGDCALFLSLGSGNWRCLNYMKADGTAIADSDAPFVDSTAIIKGSADATKLIRIEADGLTTATTRVITMPDSDLTLQVQQPTIQVFTSSDTWTKPSYLTKVKVTVIGGGGGGGGSLNTGGSSGGGGGGGGTAIKYIAAGSLGSTETVTIGAAGAASTSGGNGGNGGNSSFGAHCTGNGGSGGVQGTSGSFGTGGAGGSGASGDLNISGAAGQGGGNANNGGSGGSSALGGGGGGGPGQANGSAGVQPGGGGGGAGSAGGSTTDGAAGGAGIVIVEEFY